MSNQLSEDALLDSGGDRYGSSVFNQLEALYRKLAPHMSEPLKGLAEIVSDPSDLLQGRERTKFLRDEHNVGPALVRYLRDYIERLQTNLGNDALDVTVGPEDLRFQMIEALAADGFESGTPAVDWATNRSKLYGEKVYTGQPELGTRHGISGPSLPPD